MKSIAEFAMRGRAQSLIVAVPAAGTEIFFWLSAAIVALVTMRKGVQQGFFILLWALLPAAVLAWFMFPAALLCLLVTFAMAAVLRTTVQWSTALLAGAAGSLAAAVVLQFVFQDYLQNIVDILQPLFQKFLESGPENKAMEAMFAGFGTTELAGSFCAGAAVFAVAALATGRYWQSALYNPGGFGEEFRALRYKAPVALGLVLMAALLYASQHYRLWAWICLFPLLMAGIALVHHWVNKNSGSGGLLAMFYFLLLLLDPVKQLVCALAVVDSLLDFRSRRTE